MLFGDSLRNFLAQIGKHSIHKSLERSVIAFARLDLVALFGLDVNLAEGTVTLVVARRISQAVLAAKLIADLIKRVAQLFNLISHPNDPSSGLFAQLLHVVLAISKGYMRVAYQERIDDCIRLLCGGQSVAQIKLASLIFSVGEQYHRLASHFPGELFICSQEDSIVKQSSFGTGCGKRATSNSWSATHGSVDLGTLHCGT